MKFFTLFLSIMIGVSVYAQQSLAQESPVKIDGAKTVTTVEAKKLFDASVIFIDVREDSDWDAGRIPGAVHIDLDRDLTAKTLGQVAEKEDKIVIYCNGLMCFRSSQASKKAVNWGFTNVFDYRDGFPAWAEADFPVE
tara:strand:- start:255 stop:668 length:414 start_codon:yes stop_codon:yes gene_type:complete